MPPYHIAGIAAMLTSVYGGRRTVYLPTFTPEDWVAMAAAEHITHAMVVPTMLGRILDGAGAARRDVAALARALLRRRADAGRR